MSAPDDIDAAMADIAAVFGWAPDVLDAMTAPELARWRRLARERAEARR